MRRVLASYFVLCTLKRHESRGRNRSRSRTLARLMLAKNTPGTLRVRVTSRSSTRLPPLSRMRRESFTSAQPLPFSLLTHCTNHPHINVKMDSRSVYTVSVLPPDESFNGPDARGATQRDLMNFILDFHIDNAFIYRSALCASCNSSMLMV